MKKTLYVSSLQVKCFLLRSVYHLSSEPGYRTIIVALYHEQGIHHILVGREGEK